MLLAGCFAQQADLTRVSQDLDKKITRLDQREKEIETAMKRANEQIAQQKADVGQLINETRARLLAEIREMREEDLPKFQGKLDENLYQVNRLAGSVDDRASKLEQRFVSVEKTLSEQTAARKEETGKLSARLDATGSTLASVAKTVDGRLEEHDKTLAASDAQVRALHEQLTQWNRALTDFRQALTGLGDKLVQQEQRTNELSAKVDTDAKATSEHLEKVTKSVGSVAKALEAIGAKFVAQEEVQDRRLEEMTKSLHALTQTLTKLQGKGAKGKLDTKSVRSVPDNAPAAVEPHAAPLPTPVPAPAESTAGPTEPERESAGTNPEPAPVAATPGVEPAPDVPAASASPKADEARVSATKEAYDRSFQRFKERDYDGALAAFSAFLSRYPKSRLAPNAQYWIGECYFGKHEYGRAIAAFDQVKVINPSSEKVPAALLKKSLAYLALKDRKKAAETLTQVTEGFPKSQEANKAREKLAQLNQGR